MIMVAMITVEDATTEPDARSSESMFLEIN
jgi:hypothetical protein